MAEQLFGNILLLQVGPCSPALNATIGGAVNEALNHDCFEDIYGAVNGLDGLLRENLVDLAEEPQQVIRGMATCPGAILGSGNSVSLSARDWERAVDVLQAHNIRFVVIAGDRSALEAAYRLDKTARDCVYQLRVIAAPVSLTNEIPMTDHAPGFGSAAKDLACVVRQLSFEAQAQGEHDRIVVIEVAGKQAGWLTAAASICHRRNHPDDAPHVLLLPERPVDVQALMFRIQEILKRVNSCTIVTGSNVTDADGNYLTAVAPGSPLANEAARGSAAVIAALIEQNLDGARVTSFNYAPFQPTANLVLSRTDIDEAVMSGSAAVLAMVEDESGKFVGLIRRESEAYHSETTLVSLEEALKHEKVFPANWITEDGVGVSYQFAKYATPLIQGEVSIPFENGLPRYISITPNRIKRVLPPRV